MNNRIIVVDFGGQYNQLVARRVREAGVYCEIYSYRTPLEKLKELDPKGIILTGGPDSCYLENVPSCDPELFHLGIPVLGLCYGAQLMQHMLGGKVQAAADGGAKGEAEEFHESSTRPADKDRAEEVRWETPENSDRNDGNLSDVVDTATADRSGDSAEKDEKTLGGSDRSVAVVYTGIPAGEYGRTCLQLTPAGKASALFAEVEESSVCWMSHRDYIAQPAPGFTVSAQTKNCPCAACEDAENRLYAIQFHPEVVHTQFGSRIIGNYVLHICGCTPDWHMDSFGERAIREIREKVGEGKALCALSGGVDSSVAAALMSEAIGEKLTCVFVDHGLLRKDEGNQVEKLFGEGSGRRLQFIRVDARERFLNKLAGVTEPEKKRRIIGEEFIRVFEEEAKKLGKVDFLVQGTIYPDVVESGLGGESAVIKSHHNVGGLPDHVDFKEIIEPLRNLFKDEVRKLGLSLGLPDYLVNRQPFPGPGLGVRILGNITAERIARLQEADAIFREEVDKALEQWRAQNQEQDKNAGPLFHQTDRQGLQAPDWFPDQYFAALSDMRSVGVMGDSRTYGETVILRAVRTLDFMTADCAPIPFPILQTVMTRITNEVPGIGRVLFDLTGKPPGTIELE